ncbi:MAG TPA: hypothetical protein PLD92_10650 [Candidatus Omnitrophota bacterium]|nr:hypothetical protein [Candidatus Omnitrophota bacterium]
MKKKLVCAYCGKKIDVLAYVRVSGSIILQDHYDPAPPVFTCKEQAANYAQSFAACPPCWIAELKKRGAKIITIDEMKKIYSKQKKGGDKNGMG